MTATMAAAIFRGPEQGLSVEAVPRPAPGPGEVLVRVAACGFCHTDLHYLDHGVRTAKPPPVILGHEISGTVAEVGPQNEGWSERDRVLVPAVLPCGRCETCQRGRGNICADMTMLGNHVDGGFAEFVKVPSRHLVRLPEGVPLEQASIISDALTTPYHAVVHRARIESGESVAVVGCGGVGLGAVQFALAAGARVFAVDKRPEALRVAEALGAVAVEARADVKATVQELRKASAGGLDATIEAVGKPETIQIALGALRRGGRACLVGYAPGDVPMPANKIMFTELEVRGSLGCRPVDYPRVVDLVRRGRIRLEPLITAEVPLERIGDAAARLRRGEGLRTIVLPRGADGGRNRP